MQQLLARVKTINDLFTVMPIPEGEINTIPKLTDSELKVIVNKAVPKFWTNKQVEANFKPGSLEDLARYFEGLRKVEGHNPNKNTHANDRNK